MAARTYDPSVYFILDPECCDGKSIEDVAELALAGGATLLQYRDKVNSPDIVYHNACLLRDIAFEKRIPFLLNDYVDIAAHIDADGVHLGQDDMDVVEARSIMGEKAIIGLTAFMPDHIRAVDPAYVDYVGIGPFYPTETDKGKPVLGAERFSELAAMSPVPVVGIGGINAGNAPDVIAAGAHGVAAMRGISESEAIKAAAEAFVQSVAMARESF